MLIGCVLVLFINFLFDVVLVSLVCTLK